MSYLVPSNPLKNPANVFDPVPDVRPLVSYTSEPVNLKTTGIKNIAQLPAYGDFVWTALVIRTDAVAGAGTSAAITAGWGGTPTQILSTTSVSATAADKFRAMPGGSYVDVIPNNTQLEVEVTVATTGYTTYDAVFEIIGYHI